MVENISTITEIIDKLDTELETNLLKLINKQSILPRLENQSQYTPFRNWRALRDSSFYRFTAYYNSQPEFKRESQCFRAEVMKFLDYLNEEEIKRAKNKTVKEYRYVLLHMTKWDLVLWHCFEGIYLSPEERKKQENL